MPIVAVNVIKVLFVAALYAFLFYVARSMRGHVLGPPVDTDTSPATASGPQRRATDDTPPSAPENRSIVVFDGEGAPTTHRVHDTVVLGRGDAADIQLDDEYSSERHASFTVIGNTIIVQDLGSTNGTAIDGRRIEGRVEVAPGTIVMVGHTKVVIR